MTNKFNLFLMIGFIATCGFTAWGFPYNLPAILIGGLAVGRLAATYE